MTVLPKPPAIIRMTILQGEARASADPHAEMSTILGSCVATCLFDPVARVGGMNHFLLAEPPSHVRNQAFDSDYGLFLMELLINEMLGLGARKNRMKTAHGPRLPSMTDSPSTTWSNSVSLWPTWGSGFSIMEISTLSLRTRTKFFLSQ